MSFWTPNNEFPPAKSQSRATTAEAQVDETPLVNRDYLPDVEDSNDQEEALLLGTPIEYNDDEESNNDNDDTLILATRTRHGILSPSAPPSSLPQVSTMVQLSSYQAPPKYHIPFETYAEDDQVLTRSIRVNALSTELHSFLQQRNTTPPKIFVSITGTSNRNEHYRRTYDANGQQVTVEPVITKSSYESKIDFSYTIDCSRFVAGTSDGFHVLPERKTGYVKTVEEICSDYVQDTHRLKELQMNKVITNWDEDQLIRLIKSNIRAHGYSHELRVTIEKKETKVTVKPASRISRAADNAYIRFFFYITFLFIFTWPILHVFRKKIGHNTLQSHWRMTLSEKEWCQKHLEEILGQIPPARFGPIVQISIDP